MATELAAQMANYRKKGQHRGSTAAEAAWAKSASDAKTAAEQAATVRAGLPAKQSDLKLKIAVVESQMQTS